MPFPKSLRIHAVTVKHNTGTYTADDYGNQTPVYTSISVNGRFGHGIEQIVSKGGALNFNKGVPIILLPPETEIIKNDQIVSSVRGYAETYKVTAVKTVYNAGLSISHIKCELAAVI